MTDINGRFLRAIQEAHRRTAVHGVRSTERIKVLHGWVMDEIRGLLGRDYQVCGKSDAEGSREMSVDGWYYAKKVDVAVIRNGRVFGVVSIKAPNSNYMQNANNYFESQMGETANLRRNNIVFGNIFCITDPIPYRNREGVIIKQQQHRIRGSDIMKYKKLEQDHNHLHAPDVQALVVAKLDMQQDAIIGICNRLDMDHLADSEFDALAGMGFERFFRVLTNGIKNKFDSLQGS